MEVSLLMFLLSVDSVPLQDVSKALFLFENRFLHSRRKLKNRIFFASLQLNILHFVDIGNNLSETHVCMFLQQKNLFFFLSTATQNRNDNTDTRALDHINVCLIFTNLN